MTAHGRELAGIGFAGGAALAFGTLAIVAKLAYADGADPVPLLAVRFAAAAVLLGLYRVASRPRRNRPSRRTVINLLLLGAFGYAVESMMFFEALERAPASVVALIFYSYPAWTTMIGFATRSEPFRWQLVAALGTGLAGVALIFSLSLGRGELAGPLLALAAAITVAVYFTIAQRAARDVEATAAGMWTAVGAALALGLLSAGLRVDLPAAAVPEALMLGLATALAFAALFAALSRIGPSRASVANMLEPVATVLLAAWVLGEALTSRVLLGTTLVMASLPVLALSSRRAEVPHGADAL